MVNGAGSERGVCRAALPAPARCSVRVDVAQCSPGHAVRWGCVHGGRGSLEPPGSEAAAVDVGSPGGSGHREWGRQAALLRSGTRGLVDSRRGARPPGRVFPGAARPQTLVLTHLGCRWGRMGLTQPRMCTRHGENRMWCAEMGRKFLGAPWAPRPWDMVGAGGSTPQQSPVTAAGSTLGSSPWSA